MIPTFSLARCTSPDVGIITGYDRGDAIGRWVAELYDGPVYIEVPPEIFVVQRHIWWGILRHHPEAIVPWVHYSRDTDIRSPWRPRGPFIRRIQTPA